jgi:DNA primase
VGKLSYKVVEEMEANLPTKPGGGDEVRFCCLFCGESKYRLYVNPENERFQCFKCGITSFKTNFITLYAKTLGIDYPTALDQLQLYLEDDAKATVEEALAWLVEPEDTNKYEPLKALDSLPVGCFPYSENQDHPVFSYLLDRGFTEQELLGLNVHGTSNRNLFIESKGKKLNLKDRVIFPIYDPWTRELVTYLARATFPCGDYIPKYINAPGTELATVVAPAAFKAGADVVICEGYIDALAVRRTGLQAYCTFGKKISERQVDIILSFKPNTVTIFFDQDAENEAEKAAKRFIRALGLGKVYIADPSSLGDGIDSGDTMKIPEGEKLITKCMESKMRLDSTEYTVYKAMIGLLR